MTIGVTGHRIVEDVERIRAGIDRALDHLLAGSGASPVTVMSGLAEGADRLVAERVLARAGARLVAVLPVPAAEYAQDFSTPASKLAFDALLASAAGVVDLPPAPTRNVAYDALGRHVLAHSDVLLAVWDGQGGGATGRVVGEARRRGMPLAWVHAGNRRPGTREPTSLGPAQGVVTFERC